MLGAEAVVLQVADGSVEPGPGGVHHHGGGVVDQFADHDPVAQWSLGAPSHPHGPRAVVGIARSARTGPGARSSPVSSPTGSRSWTVAVAMTLASTCQVPAPVQVRLPPHVLRVTTAGRIACSARQFVACTPSCNRKVNRAWRSVARWRSSRRLG